LFTATVAIITVMVILLLAVAIVTKCNLGKVSPCVRRYEYETWQIQAKKSVRRNDSTVTKYC